jgi:hypothetical protein
MKQSRDRSSQWNEIIACSEQTVHLILCPLNDLIVIGERAIYLMKTQILFDSARGKEQFAITTDNDDEALQSLKNHSIRHTRENQLQTSYFENGFAFAERWIVIVDLLTESQRARRTRGGRRRFILRLLMGLQMLTIFKRY